MRERDPRPRAGLAPRPARCPGSRRVPDRSVGGDIVGRRRRRARRTGRGRRVRGGGPRRRPARAHGPRDRAGRRRVGRGGPAGRHLPRSPARRARVGGRCCARPTSIDDLQEHARRARPARVPRRLGGPAARRRCVLAADGADVPEAGQARRARRRARRPRRSSPTAWPDPRTSRSPGSPVHDAAILVGREGHVFRRRERAQLLMLARVADRAWTPARRRAHPVRLIAARPPTRIPRSSGNRPPPPGVRGWVPAVVVFTRDLRVHDHPALRAAVAGRRHRAAVRVRRRDPAQPLQPAEPDAASCSSR